MRQPSLRNAGTSFAIESPAIARIGVARERKLIGAVKAVTVADNLNTGIVASIAKAEHQIIAGI